MTISSPSVAFCRYRCRDFGNGRVHSGTMATRASAGALGSPGIVSSPFILADNRNLRCFVLPFPLRHDCLVRRKMLAGPGAARMLVFIPRKR